jgi:cysteinyl-tRNA synthetase
VRKTNTAFDAGQLRRDDVRDLLAALDKFDEIFAVIKDDDAPKMKSILEWAKTSGREKNISPALLQTLSASALADAEIESKLAEMKAARKAGDFKRSDAIRAELTAAGIIVEQTKEGARWRRK